MPTTPPLSIDLSAAELDALWNEPPYALTGANELFLGNDVMATGKSVTLDTKHYCRTWLEIL